MPEIQQIQQGRSAVLTFGAWDPRVRMVPHAAFASIPDLEIAEARASIRANGEVVYNLPGRVTRQAEEQIYEGTWKLLLPIVGCQLLTEDPTSYDTIEIPFEFELTADPVEKPADPYFPTPYELRTGTIFGIPLIDADGYLYADEQIVRAIEMATTWVEELCDLTFAKPSGQTKIVSSTPGTAGADLLDEPYDYVPALIQNYGFLQLRRRPVVEIVSLSLKLGDQPIFEFPREWLQVYGESGQIRIVPGVFASVPSSAYGLYFPAFAGRSGIFGGSADQRAIPGLFHVVYRAGLPTMPPDLRRAIGWKAAYDILNTISDSAIAGIASQSVGVDGLSQSIATTSSATNSTYGANMIFLEKLIKEFEKTAKARYKGILMTAM